MVSLDGRATFACCYRTIGDALACGLKSMDLILIQVSSMGLRMLATIVGPETSTQLLSDALVVKGSNKRRQPRTTLTVEEV